MPRKPRPPANKPMGRPLPTERPTPASRRNTGHQRTPPFDLKALKWAAACSSCGRKIQKGWPALVVEIPAKGPWVLVCTDCKADRLSPAKRREERLRAQRQAQMQRDADTSAKEAALAHLKKASDQLEYWKRP